MKVLVLVTDAYGGYGGIALYCRDLIAAIASEPRVTEVVVVPRVVRHDLEPLPPKVTFLASAARGRIAYSKALREAVRGRTFNLTICGHINLLPVARLLGSNIVLMLYGIEAWKPTRLATMQLLQRVDAVISISEITLNRFLSWSRFDGRTFLLPNAIHLERYGTAPKNDALLQRWSLHGKTVLMTFGRIVAAERYKGFDEVIEVLPDLVEARSDLAYIVAGGGTDLPRLRAKARALGVADRVVFTGPIEEREKRDLYNLADVYVMPSRGEGFGFVILEAMACGVPVVVSRFDGGFEAIRGGELGLAVDPSNPAEISTAVLDVLATGKRGIPAGLSYFAFDRFESGVHAILDHLQ
jgi:glycosyltransferase involved in cell wall biosynthesis